MQPERLDTSPQLGSNSQVTRFTLMRWQTRCTHQHWYVPYSLFLLCSPLSQACKCELGGGRRVNGSPGTSHIHVDVVRTRGAGIISLLPFPYFLHSHSLR